MPRFVQIAFQQFYNADLSLVLIVRHIGSVQFSKELEMHKVVLLYEYFGLP
jgi:hypothetical protein